MIYSTFEKCLLFTVPIAASCICAVASPYRIRLIYEPAYPDSHVQLELVHPFNTSNSPYFGQTHGYRNGTALSPEPDWGAREIDADNPEIKEYRYDGLITCTANEINDPGSCRVRVESTYKSAICILYIDAWPGVQLRAYTNTLEAGMSWDVVELPCANDIGLKIQKAKQKTQFASRKYHHVKLKATFETLDALTESNPYIRSSIAEHSWANSLNPDDNKIKKAGLIAKYGKPRVGILKNKNKKKLKIKGICDTRLQNQSVPVFVTFGGASGFEIIRFDDKSKYKH